MALDTQNTGWPSEALPAPRTATLIVNTRSRRGREWYEKSRDCLQASGIQIAAAQAITDPTHLADAVREAIERGARLVVVGGGDGTIRTTAGVLARTNATLGVLPLGTLNDFARNLEIPLDVAGACRIIAEGHVAAINLGLANDDYFLITASLGFSAMIQRALTPGLKRWFGGFAYLIASLIAWKKLRHFRIGVSDPRY